VNRRFDNVATSTPAARLCYRRRMRWRLASLCPFMMACTNPSKHDPSVVQAAEAYMAVHNVWDDEAARALWGNFGGRV
jgi:hypothetical protein